MVRLTPEQAESWIINIHNNLSRFRLKENLTAEEKLAFVSQQYSTLLQLARAIEGKVRFVGVPIPNYTEK